MYLSLFKYLSCFIIYMNVDTRYSSFVILDCYLQRWINEESYLRLQTLPKPKNLTENIVKWSLIFHCTKGRKEINGYEKFISSQILLISSNDESCWGRSSVFSPRALSLRTLVQQQSRTQLETVRQEMTLRADYSLQASDDCTLQLHWLHSPRPHNRQKRVYNIT